jgi:hypothetical protein
MIRYIRQELSYLVEATLLVRRHIVNNAIGTMNPRTAKSIKAEIFFKCCCFDNFWACIEQASNVSCNYGEM